MYKLYFSFLFLSGLLCGGLAANAQINKISLLIPPFQYDSTNSTQAHVVSDFHGYVMKALLREGQFSVVERDENAVIAAERELQKSEAFMDGKFVEQGKAVGASFIVSGVLDNVGLLTLTVTDVATGSKIEAEICDLSSNFSDRIVVTKPALKKINKSVQELVNRWLLKDKFTLVRILEEKGDKARKVLVAGGSAKGIKEGSVLEVFYIEKETVDEEVLERFVQVGELKVEFVENANFSQAKVRDGETEVKKYLTEGKKLYCRLSNSK